MTTFNISDLTFAGAYCNAIKAANESDRNRRRYHGAIDSPVRSKTADKTSNSPADIATIRNGWNAVVRLVQGPLVRSRVW